jgi:hypothetical protein
LNPPIDTIKLQNFWVEDYKFQSFKRENVRPRGFKFRGFTLKGSGLGDSPLIARLMTVYSCPQHACCHQKRTSAPSTRQRASQHSFQLSLMTSLHTPRLQSIIPSTPVDLHHQRAPFLLNTSFLYPRHHLPLITRDLDYNRTWEALLIAYLSA